MRVLTSAHLAVCRVPRAVSVEAGLAVLAVPSFGIVSTRQTDGSTLVARQLVQLQTEATSPGVQVAVACWIYMQNNLR